MCETRLPDCRPLRRDPGVSSASSHPELISGDLTMRPRLHLAFTGADLSTWFRNLATICAFVVGVFLLHAILHAQPAPTAQSLGMGDPALTPSCAEWHQAASAAVAHLAESTRDADLRQVSDAIFRMRRARRNCEDGWYTHACQDYHAVARNLPGKTGTNEESLFDCRRAAS